MDFRWNAWNEEHIARHGVAPDEAESVVSDSHPRYRGDGKYRVVGRGQGGRWLQVVYVLDEDGTVYVIHARPLTDSEKRNAEAEMRKTKKPYWEMTTDELAQATREFDREDVGETFCEMTPAEEKAWRAAVSKRPLPRSLRTKGVTKVSFEIDVAFLLKRVDALAKKRGISRAHPLTEGLEAMLTKARKLTEALPQPPRAPRPPRRDLRNRVTHATPR